MPAAAVRGDRVAGGAHCHGHDHGPQPAPGRIIKGSDKVFICGRPAARLCDPGYSVVCCGKVGQIQLVNSPGVAKVLVDGFTPAVNGTKTSHCGMGIGQVVCNSKVTFS